jgi:hypothetical protein
MTTQYRANITANSLIRVDMSTMRAEKWSNITLPDNVPGRANAEIAWIPVSESGALIAIGGVINPEIVSPPTGLTGPQQVQSVRFNF